MVEGSVPFVESGCFGKYTEVLADRSWISFRVMAKDGYPARGPTDEIEEDIDYRGFAGSVRAEEAEHLTVFDLEADVTESLCGSELLCE
jgi:hypothetical protein